MDEAAPGRAVCEVCGKAVARRDDLLCGDCSRAFTLMLEVLHGHPEVDVEDVDRIKQVFEWRMRKKGLTPSTPEVQEEQRILSAALSVLRRKEACGRQESEPATAVAE
jgi:hypothetical protein